MKLSLPKAGSYTEQGLKRKQGPCETGSWAGYWLDRLCISVCDSKGAREESAQAGAEAVRRRARKQRHRNNRVGSLCGCTIHQEMGSTEKTIDFCPHDSLQVEVHCEGS